MKKNTIPIINGEIYEDLKVSYTGGSVDVYKSFGNNIKGYDVNSLYPSMMLEKDIPVGNPVQFEGDISKFESNPFGFFWSWSWSTN